jgi:hypothetical protein
VKAQRKSQTCDAREEIVRLQTFADVVGDLSTERESNDMNVFTTRISDTVHELSRARSDMLNVAHSNWVENAR